METKGKKVKRTHPSFILPSRSVAEPLFTRDGFRFPSSSQTQGLSIGEMPPLESARKTRCGDCSAYSPQKLL